MNKICPFLAASAFASRMKTSLRRHGNGQNAWMDKFLQPGQCFNSSDRQKVIPATDATTSDAKIRAKGNLQRITRSILITALTITVSVVAVAALTLYFSLYGGHDAGFLYQSILLWTVIVIISLIIVGYVTCNHIHQTQALIESEERFRNLVEGSIEGILIHHNLKPLFVNQAYADILGYRQTDEILALDSIEPHLAPQDRSRIWHYNQARLKGEQAPVQYIYDAIRKDGKTIVLQNVARLIQWYGQPAVQVTVMDITERRRSEKGLIESEARYRQVVNSQTELICHFCPDTKLTFVNDTYCRYFGKTRDELIGSSFLSFVPEHEQSRIKTHIKSLLLDPRMMTSEYEVLLPDGRTRWQQWVNHPIHDFEGRIIEFQSVGRDITEHKRLQESNRHRQAELAHAARLSLMGEMASSLAHELNQPLAAITSYCDMALATIHEGSADPEILIPPLEQSVLQARRASEIIRHLREFIGKDSSGQTSIDLNAMIKEAVEFIDTEAWEKHVSLELKLDDRLSPLPADRIQIEQVLVNLLHNGIEAIDRSHSQIRQITVRTFLQEDGKVRITIGNSGPPLDQSVLKQIFTPLRLNKIEGLDMGLSVCRSIVEAHRGHLWAESGIDRGTLFHFTLPLDSS